MWLLAVPVLVSVGYYWLAAWLLWRWGRESAPRGSVETDPPPATFFRPLKSGVPDLAAKLELLAQALRPGDQLLIGAAVDSEELAGAEALVRKFSAREIVAVACEPGGARNPKIAKLRQMEPHARHGHWILSDSETVLDADFLAAFRAEWTACDVITAGYRLARVATWPQRLDAAAVLLTLWPGLAVVRRAGAVRFTLGACTGFRRDDLREVGGWAAFADDLAEDNRLGAVLASAGRTIRLSAANVTLESDPLSWRDYWRHQRRVAMTYRVANPVGFAGSILTHGVTAGLALLGVGRGAGWVWALLALVFISRWLAAHFSARALGFPRRWLGPTVLLASVVETACWALSWGTRAVWWSGQYWRISRAGKLDAMRPW